MSETFGIEAGPASFDVDAWIAQAARPQRTVTVYGRADLVARLDEIDAEVARHRAAGGAEEALADLRAEWDDLAEAFSASALPVTVRGLTGAEEFTAIAAARAARPDLVDAGGALSPAWHEFVGLHLLAAAIVSPAMTLDQVVAIHAKVGSTALAPLAAAVQALTSAGTVVPATPFSEPSSGSTPA